MLAKTLPKPGWGQPDDHPHPFCYLPQFMDILLPLVTSRDKMMRHRDLD